MIVPPPRRVRPSDDNILPLINIVFLLLIFFMLAGVLAQRSPFALTPPTTHHAGQRTQLAHPVLSVGAHGQLALGGQPIATSALKTALADWPRNKTLQVRADGRLKSGDLGALLQRLHNAGISKIELLTRHGNP